MRTWDSPWLLKTQLMTLLMKKMNFMVASESLETHWCLTPSVIWYQLSRYLSTSMLSFIHGNVTQHARTSSSPKWRWMLNKANPWKTYWQVKENFPLLYHIFLSNPLLKMTHLGKWSQILAWKKQYLFVFCGPPICKPLLIGLGRIRRSL